MRLLLLDNNRDPESWGAGEVARAIHESGAQATVCVRRPSARDLPPRTQGYDALILSGSRTSALDQSPWVEDLLHWVRNWLVTERPLLGICFGHQMLARALAGTQSVARATHGEHGATQVSLVHESRLFEGVGRRGSTCVVQSAHDEEVVQLPPEFVVTATSELCRIQAMESERAPVFGVQFHPERDGKNQESEKVRRRIFLNFLKQAS